VLAFISCVPYCCGAGTIVILSLLSATPDFLPGGVLIARPSGDEKSLTHVRGRRITQISDFCSEGSGRARESASQFSRRTAIEPYYSSLTMKTASPSEGGARVLEHVHVLGVGVPVQQVDVPRQEL
jgi:hypothetical protein